MREKRHPRVSSTLRGPPAVVEGLGARSAHAGRQPTIRGHLAILRVEHWIKNLFVLPGLVIAWAIDPQAGLTVAVWPIVIGLLAVCLVTSSNYVLNDLFDAQEDRVHPTKHRRPVPSGRVHRPLAYLQLLGLAAIGLGLGATVSTSFVLALVALWSMGWIYNVPPLRTKNLPHVDVISEAANNPVRLVAGWTLASPTSLPPVSLLASYWMIGAYFMALKRFAEYRAIGDPQLSAAARRSFRYYTEERLLMASAFYGSSAMLLLGVFVATHRPQLVAVFPLVALVMAIYLSLGFKTNSPLQRPEALYREPTLVVVGTLCAVVAAVLLFVDLPV